MSAELETLVGTPWKKPASVMGRASVKGFGQVKNPGEDLILLRVLRHKFRSLLFLFHCTGTSGLKDTPLSGLRSSVRSQPHGCHSMPGPNLVLGAHLLRVFSVSR